MEAVTTFIIVLPIITAALTIISFFIARSTDLRKKGQDDGSLNADIQYIKRRVDDVLLEQKETNKTLDDHAERITRVEESTKQAHKRIDGLEKDGNRKNAAKE